MPSPSVAQRPSSAVGGAEEPINPRKPLCPAGLLQRLEAAWRSIAKPSAPDQCVDLDRMAHCTIRERQESLRWITGHQTDSLWPSLRFDISGTFPTKRF